MSNMCIDTAFLPKKITQDFFLSKLFAKLDLPATYFECRQLLTIGAIKLKLYRGFMLKGQKEGKWQRALL